MLGRKRRKTAADLSRAAARFEQWRRRRARGARIPAALWETASKLAARHGVSRTATALKLDYYALKKHLVPQALPAIDTNQSEAQPTFVELAPPGRASPGQCLIEFANGTGSTLRVYLPGGQVPDLIALGRSFSDPR